MALQGSASRAYSKVRSIDGSASQAASSLVSSTRSVREENSRSRTPCDMDIAPSNSPLSDIGENGASVRYLRFSRLKAENGAMEKLAAIRLGWLERGLAAMDRIANRGGKAAMPAHLAIGEEGETAAFFYLRRKGYVVVARRWSCGDRPGDIDLIAWQGSLLCVVEVKTRSAR